MDLSPIRGKRLSEYAVTEIRKFILNNNIEEGSPLPSERELLAKLQISRGTLREALRILEISGVVKVRPGKGTFVSRFTDDFGVPLPTWVSGNKDAIYKHFETRLILEPEIAALAARRATEEDIHRMEQNILFQKSLPEDQVVSIIRADIEFHCLLAEASKNETNSMLMNLLARISFHGWKAAMRVKGRNESAVEEHGRLVRMLAKRDEDGARTAMRKHMLESIRILKEQGLDLPE